MREWKTFLFPSPPAFQLLCLAFRPLQWTVEIMCIGEGPRRRSSRSRDSSSKSWTNSIKHSAGTADAPTVPAFYPSPSSTGDTEEQKKEPRLWSLWNLYPHPVSATDHLLGNYRIVVKIKQDNTLNNDHGAWHTVGNSWKIIVFQLLIPKGSRPRVLPKVGLEPASIGFVSESKGIAHSKSIRVDFKSTGLLWTSKQRTLVPISLLAVRLVPELFGSGVPQMLPISTWLLRRVMWQMEEWKGLQDKEIKK